MKYKVLGLQWAGVSADLEPLCPDFESRVFVSLLLVGCMVSCYCLLTASEGITLLVSYLDVF